MSNQLVWMDIPVADLSRAIQFYSAVLGVEITVNEDLVGFPIGLLPQMSGAVSGCLKPADSEFQPSAQGPRLYLNCNGRLEAAQAAVEPNGGKILQAIHAFGEFAFRTLILDTEGNSVALCSTVAQNLDQMVRRAKQSVRNQPNYPWHLIQLAQNLANQGHSLKAYEVCRRAMALAPVDPDIARLGRKLLARVVPGYHGPMVNDVRRNIAWEKALKRAIKPGDRVLEIGTGPGMLAMMAAKAGAQVITCEYHPVVALIADEIVSKNGLAAQVKVLSKSSLDLQVGVDLDEPAEMLFCDNFADGLFGFRPLQSIADAQQRLLKPGARVMPARVAAPVALCDWAKYRNLYEMDQSAGFDVSIMADLVLADVDLNLGDSSLSLMSEGKDIFRFDFQENSYSETGRAEVTLEANADGEVNGIVQWIRLELDDEIILESRPEPGAVFFSNPRFYPLPRTLAVKKGDEVKVYAEHDHHSLSVWTDLGQPKAS